MLASRVRMSMRREKNSEVGEIEVTIHTSGFEYLYVYVGDGTLDQWGDPSVDALIYASNSDETITLMVEKGSYITVDFHSRIVFGSYYSFYYTSLDSTYRDLTAPPYGGLIHITEPMDIYYGSINDD